MSVSNRSRVLRYNGVAIGLHWLIAILVLGLLVIGKYMTGLDEADPQRFLLTQWHKTFGICVLLFSVLRVFWRLAHKPPALPRSTRRWERVASGFTHFLLYLLILGLPLTGWIMVSASPLNISTLLFNVFPFPHLPPFPDLTNKAEIAELFHTIHEMASGVLIALLLLHIGAALRHQFVQHDAIMSRMSLDFSQATTRDGTAMSVGIIIAMLLGALLFKSALTEQTSRIISPEADSALVNDASVGFTLVIMGDELKGQFKQSSVTVNLDPDNPAASTLQAEVQTASGTTGSPQVDDALPGADWFDVTNHPTASFNHTAISKSGPNIFAVEGELTIRETTQPVSFELSVDQQSAIATGGFTINRLDFKLGAMEQPDDTHAGYNVLINFEFVVE